MTKKLSPFDFENYQPRGPIGIPIPRRGFLQAMITELHAYNEKVDGKPTLKLADLALLPDDELAVIRPVKAQDCTISLRDRLVWAKPANTIDPVALFPVDSPALVAFNLFDGDHDLQHVRQELVEQTGWPVEKCWAYTRGLFLRLVSLRVCVPK